MKTLKSDLFSSAIILFPFTFIPCLLFLVKNAHELTEVSPILWRGLILFLLSFGCVLLGRAFRLDMKRVSVFLAVLLYLFFGFQFFLKLFTKLKITDGELILWTITTLLAGTVCYRLSKLDNFRFWIVLTGYLLLFGYSYQYWSIRPSTPVNGNNSQQLKSLKKPGKKPINIYTFILDGYPSQETLKRVFHYDNVEFFHGLEELGFHISDHTYANYPATFLSLASMMQMEYVATKKSDGVENKPQFYRMIVNNNRLLGELFSKGYSYISGGTVGVPCSDREADLCLKKQKKGIPLEEEDFAILAMTPMPYVLRSLGLKLGESYLLPINVTKQALSFKKETSNPIFLFAHIQSPHNGERFDANCELTGDWAVRGPNPVREVHGRTKFVEEIKCVSREMIAAAKMIVSEDPNSIILITADHGSAFTSDFKKNIKTWTEDELSERYQILWAIRSPECNVAPNAPDSLINTYPVVLSCIDESVPIFVKDRFFFYNYDKEFEEIFPPWKS